MFKTVDEDLDHFKKKREDFSFSIRRNNREEFFNKRRNIVEVETADQQSNEENIIDLQSVEDIKKMHNETFYLDHIQEYVQMMNSKDYLTKLHGIIAIRKLIDGERRETYHFFLSSDLVTQFIGFLSNNEEPQIKLEAAWLFSSLTYGKNVCRGLVKRNIVEPLLQLLIEDEVFIVDQVLVSIGNISADHEDLRDIVLNNSGLEIIFKLLSSHHKPSTYLSIIWVITNLCRGNTPANHHLVEGAIDILCKETRNKQLQNFENPEVSRVIQDILSTFSVLSEKSKSHCNKIIDGNVLPLIFNLALSENYSHALSSIRIIGNLANQREYQTEALIEHGIFDLSLKLLENSRKFVRRETCWILSNIAAGNASQAKKFLERRDVLDKLIEMMKSDILDIKQEIAWVFPNLGDEGEKRLILNLFEHADIMRLYIDMLDEDNPQFLSDILKCILKVLVIGNKSLVDGNNKMLIKFMEYGGTEKVDKLQYNQSSSVYKSAVSIITRFFDVEETI